MGQHYVDQWKEFEARALQLFQECPRTTRILMKYKQRANLLKVKVTNDIVV